MVLAVTSILFSSVTALAQGDSSESHVPLDGADREKIINWICDHLIDTYIYLETAEKMQNHLRKQMKKGAYDDRTNIGEFARALTRDLQLISKDLHVKVLVNADPPPPESASEEEKEERRREDIERDRRENFHFKKVEIHSGNVGYLRFDKFADPRYAGPTAVAAMNFLANCDALIIDLRYNGGGHSTMEQLLLSYFFDEPVHLTTYYTRSSDLTEQGWTHAYVNGPKLLDVDLYILTSSNQTFSAAEGFAYAVKNQGRGTIVGEVTTGGGHPIEFHYLREYDVELRVSISRAFDPKTGKDFEVVGVEPDAKVPAEKAFYTAYMMALENLSKQSHEPQKPELTWKYEYQKALLEPVRLDDEVLQSYAGTYGPLQITFDRGELLLLEPEKSTYQRLLAVSETLFVVEGNEKIRGEFELNERGEVVAIVGIRSDGSMRRMARTADERIPAEQSGMSKSSPAVSQGGTLHATGNQRFVEDMGITFVSVKGGEFDMGDTFAEGSRTEVPVHTVSLDDYYLSTTEVTFAQYDVFCEATGREKPGDEGWGRGSRPVVNVSWEDAEAFCAWLSQKSGQEIRLPTEAEWEYAAREGGKRVRFGNGEEFADPSEINFDGSEEHQKPYAQTGASRRQTLPVGSFTANALGLHDMSGNVWEMCSDWYDREYYRYSPSMNPTGADAGTYRSIRGGSWDMGPSSQRCSTRGAYTPTARAKFIGFRLAKDR
jgi:formylglycine-generating enzyme required for sulfatase activity